jgi:hypothetical protein
VLVGNSENGMLLNAQVEGSTYEGINDKDHARFSITGSNFSALK